MEYFKSLKSKEEFGQLYFFPSEKDLVKFEIKFQHLIQKPGDAVYTGYAAIHWVLNPVSFLFYLQFRMEGIIGLEPIMAQ